VGAVRRFLRALWQTGLGAAFTATFVGSYVVLGVMTFGWFTRAFRRDIMRAYAKGMLAIAQVEIDVEGAEHLAGAANRIATFNHASLLDDWIVFLLAPPGGMPVVKREALFYPIIGLGILLLDFVVLDRGNSERARATLKRAVVRMKSERLTLIIAPEGTRAKSDELSPFKLGAFHLALESRAPIVPIVIYGARALQPAGALQTKRGRVRIRVLPPIPTDDFEAGNLREKAESLRALYARELEAMRET
jgi:1-acyl-sn-glycerol-3-phosphate acyltransferase